MRPALFDTKSLKTICHTMLQLWLAVAILLPPNVSTAADGVDSQGQQGQGGDQGSTDKFTITPEEALQKYTLLVRPFGDEYIGGNEDMRRDAEKLQKDGTKGLFILGEAGEGKTVYKRAFAAYLADPKNMNGRPLEVRELDWGAINNLASDAERIYVYGQLVKGFANTNRVLDIDEVHRVWGDSSFLQEFKQPIADGLIRFNFSTTVKEFRETLGKDPTIVSRGATRYMTAMTKAKVMTILESMATKYMQSTPGLYIDETALKFILNYTFDNASTASIARMAKALLSEAVTRMVFDKAIGRFDLAANRDKIGGLKRTLENLEQLESLKSNETRLARIVQLKQDLAMEEADLARKIEIDNAERSPHQQALAANSEVQDHKQDAEEYQKAIRDNQKILDESSDASQKQKAEGVIADAEEALDRVIKAMGKIVVPNAGSLMEIDVDFLKSYIASEDPTGDRVKKDYTQIRNELAERVPGIPEVTTKLAEVIFLAPSQMQANKKPSAIILTGVKSNGIGIVGKEAAEINRLNFVDLNLTTRTGHDSLLGVAEGYKGMDSQGPLDFLEQKPRSLVVLRMGLGTAHEHIKVVEELLDTGFITNTKGKVLDGRKAVFVIVSDAGAEFVLSGKRQSQEELLSRYGRQGITAADLAGAPEHALNAIANAELQMTGMAEIKNLSRYVVSTGLPTLAASRRLIRRDLMADTKYVLDRHGVVIEWGRGMASLLAAQSYTPKNGIQEYESIKAQQLNIMLTEIVENNPPPEWSSSKADRVIRVNYQFGPREAGKRPTKVDIVASIKLADGTDKVVSRKTFDYRPYIAPKVTAPVLEENSKIKQRANGPKGQDAALEALKANMTHAATGGQQAARERIKNAGQAAPKGKQRPPRGPRGRR